jgi:hypothetical protein
MKTRGLHLLVVAGLLAANCGTSPVGQSSEVAKPSAPKCPPADFDRATASFDPTFIPSDIATVLDCIADAPQKGEFEANKDYRARISGAAYKQPATYVFAGPCGKDFQYDAETEKFVGGLDAGRLHSLYDFVEGERDGLLTLKTIVVTNTGPLRSSRKASNAFGVTVDVESSFYLELGIAVSNNNRKNSMEVELRVPRTEAATFRDHLRSFIVANSYAGPDTLKFAKTEVVTTATITSPHETTVQGGFLRVSSVALWIVDQRTGAILLKHDYVK